MAFDHGQSRIAPLNLILIAANWIVWHPYVPWWILAVLAVVALVMTGDHLTGMFVVLAASLIALLVGLTVRALTGS